MEDEEVIIAGTAFDVPTDNYDEFDHEIDPARLGKKLRQENPHKGSVREYQFYAENHLLLNFIETKNARAKYFRVNLACLSSEPERNRIIKWNWLYAAAAAGTLSGMCLFLAIAKYVKLEYCAIAGGISLTAALIFALIFLYLMRDEFIFKSRFGNARLFLLENKKPEQQAFDNFFISLQQAIDRAQSKTSVSDRLIEELKMCRRLRDEGIIDDAAYTVARTAIFKHEQYKA
jgi:hypothetical protein